jgi:hypothetical protein
MEIDNLHFEFIPLNLCSTFAAVEKFVSDNKFDWMRLKWKGEQL